MILPSPPCTYTHTSSLLLCVVPSHPYSASLFSRRSFLHKFSPVSPSAFTSLAQPDNVSIQLVWEGLKRKLIFYPPPPSLSHVPAEVWLPDEPLHGLREGLGRGLAQEARLPVCHALQGAPRVHSDNGAATVHGLHRNYPKMLSARGVEDGGAALQQCHLQRIWGGAEESNTVLQVELRC